MKEDIKKKLINKIFDNIHQKDISSGMVIASPSKEEPDYYYHWIRDSAIIMRILLKHYINNPKDYRCFKQIIDYIENEYHLQNIDSISGLGEPKFNVDRTAFNFNWGRPQNDGPALRGIVMLDIYQLLKKDYGNLVKCIIEIICKDINYIMKNIHNPSFDLWEEIYGYHLYTRMVQLKFMKELVNMLNSKEILDITYFNSLQKNKLHIMKCMEELKELISHHNISYSSFDLNGNSCREFDASILLGIAHVDYDCEVFDIYNHQFKNFILDMINYFYMEYDINKDTYENKKFIYLGRYKDDVYFGGNPWIITTTALISLLIHYKNTDYEQYLHDNMINEQTIDKFIKYIKSIEKLDMDEQVDRESGRFISAAKLTWNYAELYRMFSLLKK